MSKYAIKSSDLSEENITFKSFKNFLKKLIAKFASKKIEASEINVGGGSLVVNKNKLEYKSVNYVEKDYTDNTEDGHWSSDAISGSSYLSAHSSSVEIADSNLIFNYVRKGGVYAVYYDGKCLISNFELNNLFTSYDSSSGTQVDAEIDDLTPLTIPISSLAETLTEENISSDNLSKLKLYWGEYDELNSAYDGDVYNTIVPYSYISASNTFGDSGNIKTSGYDLTFYGQKNNPTSATAITDGQIYTTKMVVCSNPTKGEDSTVYGTLDSNGFDISSIKTEKTTTDALYLGSDEIKVISSDASTDWIEV